MAVTPEICGQEEDAMKAFCGWLQGYEGTSYQAWRGHVREADVSCQFQSM
jgi:hypothetical protein